MLVQDYTLDLLLDLDGLFIEVGMGYSVKIEAKEVRYSTNKPFGIKYSLTLHTPDGKRVLGYDNAHSIPGNKHYLHDHIHKSARMFPYEYESAEKLLSDFWNDVHSVLKRSIH